MWQDGLNATGKSLLWVYVCVSLTWCTNRGIIYCFFFFPLKKKPLWLYARGCVGSLWCVQRASASQGHLCYEKLSTSQPHYWLISYSHAIAACEGELICSPEGDKKDKLISESKLLISTSLSFPSPLFLSNLPSRSIYLHCNHTPLYFCHLLSLFPLSLPPYLSISIILLPVITPPPPLYHHHASRLSRTLSLSLPFMPFPLPSIFTQTCKRVLSSSFHQKQFN